MQVSVIVPIYNVEQRFFTKCLHSLLQQTLQELEYLFIDDASTDNSMAVLEEVLAEYPERQSQVRIFRQAVNGGSGAARRLGMQQAQGEYVIHCDADDWVDADMYEQMYHKAKEADADIVYCGIYMEYGYKQRKQFPKVMENDREGMKRLQWDVRYSSLCTKMVRRSLYCDHHIYPFEGVNLWEDLGVSVRLRFFSRKTVSIQASFYHYNKQNSSSIVTSSNAKSEEEQIRCAQEIERFFCEQQADGEFFLLIHCLKFLSKRKFLLNKSIRNLERWKNTFPETHRYIWQYKERPLYMRIGYWLAANGCACLVCFLLDTGRQISRCVKRCRAH